MKIFGIGTDIVKTERIKKFLKNKKFIKIIQSKRNFKM